MSNMDIVRAWKDAEYRQSLSAEDQALLPEHPAGAIELAEEELDQVAGGLQTNETFQCCLTVVSVCGYCTFIYHCIPPLTE